MPSLGFQTVLNPTPSTLPPTWIGDPSGVMALANGQVSLSNTFTLQLANLAGSLTPPVINPVFPAGPTAPAQNTATAPTFQNVVWVSPNAPAAFTEVLDVDDIMPEPFDESPPVLAFAAAPTPFSETTPAAPGVDLTYTEPTLDLQLPSPPQLLTLNITSFSGLNMPTAPTDPTTLTAVEPTIREYIPGAQYTSALLTSLQTSLKDRIDNGGTGLAPAVEDAIWDRGREREARSARDALRDLDRMESMGFALPPGVYLDARIRVQTEMDYQNRGHSREVMIKAAELEQANVQHALTTATGLESTLINYSNQVEQRLFESTKYATEAGIAIYNAKVQAYAAYLDAYKTKAAIYEAQVRAQIARVDAYKAEIEAEVAKAQVNTALVEQYKGQVQAALSAVDVYKARLDGIRIRAEIEKMKIETYGEQIRAYVARINAYTAGVEGFRASIEAEKSKQDAYRSAVEAFKARVDAAVSQASARIAEYEGKIKVKSLEWEGYKAQYAGEASKAQAISAFNSSLADEYKAEVTAVTSFNETLTKQWQVALDQAQRVSEIGVNAAKANAELYITARQLGVEAAKVGAQVTAQLGAAALNAVNWSSSFSNSNSTSLTGSNSNSYSLSNSNSDSFSENHNYSYSN